MVLLPLLFFQILDLGESGWGIPEQNACLYMCFRVEPNDDRPAEEGGREFNFQSILLLEVIKRYCYLVCIMRYFEGLIGDDI